MRPHLYHHLVGKEFAIQPGLPFRYKTPYAIPAGTRMVVTRTCDVDELGVWAREVDKPNGECLLAGSYVLGAMSKEERGRN
jgi:hypothetical protein